MKEYVEGFLAFVTPMLLVVAAAYYQGYWGPFNIDAYSYIALSDIVKGIGKSSFHIASGTIAFIVIILFYNFIRKNIFNMREGGTIKRLSSLEQISSTLLSINALIISLALVALFCSFTLTKNSQVFTVKLIEVSLISFGIVFLYKKSQIHTSSEESTFINKHELIIHIIIFSAMFWPFTMFKMARADSLNIIRRQSFYYTLLPADSTKSSNALSNKMLMRFLGKLGDNYVFGFYYDPNIIIVSDSELPKLTLIRYIEEEPKTKQTLKYIIDKHNPITTQRALLSLPPYPKVIKNPNGLPEGLDIAKEFIF